MLSEVELHPELEQPSDQRVGWAQPRAAGRSGIARRQGETHKAIAKRGAFLGFDTVGHRLAQGDAKKVALILKVLEAGYEEYILLSSDFASDPEFKAAGGAGYSSVSTVFLPN